MRMLGFGGAGVAGAGEVAKARQAAKVVVRRAV
jgi:hypothetical protein